MAPGDDVPLVSIVVPTRNRVDDLRICIDSLLAQTYAPDRVEVIVVDDGSTDATQPMAHQYGQERVRVLTQPHGGASAARNAGLAAALSDPVCFVDDDTEAPPHWLQAMVDGFGRHPEADAFAGPVRPATGAADRPTCADHPLVARLDLGPADRDTDLGLGANMAVRRRAVERVGGFDEWIAIGGEDTEWFERLGAAGGRTVYVADAWLLHRPSTDRLGLPALVRMEFRRGAASHRYFIRTGRVKGRWRSSSAATVRLLSHAVRHRCTGGLAQAARNAGIAYGLWRHRNLQPPTPAAAPDVRASQ